MIIPLWIISVIIVLCYIVTFFYFIGILFYILKNNKLGVFSENPILWALLICIGGPGSYLLFRYIILKNFLSYTNYYSIKPDRYRWEFPNNSKIHTQECYINMLISIWGFSDGIRGRMLSNWKHFY